MPNHFLEDSNGTKYATKVTEIFLFSVVLLMVISFPTLASQRASESSPISEAHAQTASAFSSSLPIQNSTSSTTSSDPLVAVTGTSLSKSFSYPMLQFQGTSDAFLNETITWYQNGNVAISDSRGKSIVLGIPTQDGTFSLLQNSTTVDQKFESTNVNFDVYWKPVTNAKGFVDHYKFNIIGTTSSNASNSSNYQLKFYVSSNLTIVSQGSNENTNRVLAISNQSLNSNVTSPEGVGFDWSDAVSSGYSVAFDNLAKAITFSVGPTFSIDPTTVDTIASGVAISPPSTDYYEGERRVVNIGSTTYTFYYDGSNIVYKYSTDGGNTWSSKFSTGSGPVNGDNYRWSIAYSNLAHANYISVLYYYQTSGTTTFAALRGTVNTVSNSITWQNGTLNSMPTPTNYSSCNNSVCAAVTAATDSDQYIHAAFRWFSSGSFTYQYRILISKDGGLTYSITDPCGANSCDSTDTYRIEMTLTSLGSGNMLFAYAKYDTNDFTYRAYSAGTGTWDTSEKSANCNCMTANTIKQISSTTVLGSIGKIAFLPGAPGSALYVSTWHYSSPQYTGSGLVNSSLSYYLPSITYVSSGQTSALRIYTLANSKVYELVEPAGGGATWSSPVNPFGTGFSSSPDELTAAINVPDAIWEQTSGSAINVQFGTDSPASYIPPLGQVHSLPATLSPPTTEYYEGERRMVNIGGAIFSFYYDGSGNIDYQTSTDLGATWSTPTHVSTGQIASDSFRWTLATNTAGGSTYITLFYYTVSGSNTQFIAQVGQLNGTTAINWRCSCVLFSKSGTNMFAAAVASPDTNGNVFVAYRYLVGSQYSFHIYKIVYSTSISIFESLTEQSASVGTRIEMVLSSLANGNMLFAYTRYDTSSVYWWSYSTNSNSWISQTSFTPTGMASNTIKQVSATSDYNGNIGMAYLSGGTSGTPYVAWWNSAGSYKTAEQVDYSSTSHSLPSLEAEPSGKFHLFTIASGSVFVADRPNNSTTPLGCSGCWSMPSSPFSGTYFSPNELTAGISYNSALWEDGSSPANIYAGIIPFRQPYIFAYDSGPASVVREIYGYNNFTGSTPSSLHYDVLSMLTTAGWKQSQNAVSGYTYQGVVRLAPDNTVRADPQVYDLSDRLVWGCFLTNTCTILTNGTAFGYAYQDMIWNSANTTVTFTVTAHDTSGNLYTAQSVYTPSPGADDSNAFADGIVTSSNINNYPGQTVTFKLLQVGIESDGETPAWQAMQYSVGMTDIHGQTIPLANKNVKEGTSIHDPTNGAQLTYYNQVATEIGFNPYYDYADYHNRVSSVPKGDVRWYPGPPTVSPATQLWTNP